MKKTNILLYFLLAATICQHAFGQVRSSAQSVPIITSTPDQTKNASNASNKYAGLYVSTDMNKINLVPVLGFTQKLAQNKKVRVNFTLVKNTSAVSITSGKSKSLFSQRRDLISGAKSIFGLNENQGLQRVLINSEINGTKRNGPYDESIYHNVEEDINPDPGIENKETSNGYCISGTQKIDFLSPEFSIIDHSLQGRLNLGLIYNKNTIFGNSTSFSTQEFGDDRTPIDIYCDELANSYKINNPTPSNLSQINNAIVTLRNAVPRKAGGMGMAWSNLDEVKTQAEFYVKISGGGKCAYGTLDGMFSSDESEKTFKFCYDFQNPMFTLKASPPQNNIFFANGDANQDPTKMDGAYLREITYGRRLIISIEASKTMSDIKSEIKTTFNSLIVKGYANMDYASKRCLETTKIKVLIIGGNLDKGSVITFTDFNKLREAILDYQNDNDPTNAAPLNYSFTDLRNNYIASQISVDPTSNTYEACFNPNSKLRVRCINIRGNDNTLDMFGWFKIEGFDKNNNPLQENDNKSTTVGLDFPRGKAPLHITANGDYTIIKNDDNASRAFNVDLIAGGKIVINSNFTDQRSFGDEYYISTGTLQRGWGYEPHHSCEPFTLNLIDGGVDGIIRNIAKSNNGTFLKSFAFRGSSGKFITLDVEFSLIDN